LQCYDDGAVVTPLSRDVLLTASCIEVPPPSARRHHTVVAVQRHLVRVLPCGWSWYEAPGPPSTPMGLD